MGLIAILITFLLSLLIVSFLFNIISIKKKSEPTLEEDIVLPQRFMLNTHAVKFSFYSSDRMQRETKELYKKIIIDNLWIDEPFHSNIFTLLLILDYGFYFYKDTESNSILANIRDEDDQLVTVETCSTLSTLEATQYCISICMDTYRLSHFKNARTLTFAIIIWIIENSHNAVYDDSFMIMFSLFDDKEYSEIDKIIGLLNENDSNYWFINSAFDAALSQSKRSARTFNEDFPKHPNLYPNLYLFEKRLLSLEEAV